MAWTLFEEEQLRYLKGQGVGHEEIARRLHKRTQDVVDKIREHDFIPCECCRRNTPLKYAAAYEMPDGTDINLCAACGAVVDFINSFSG